MYFNVFIFITNSCVNFVSLKECACSEILELVYFVRRGVSHVYLLQLLYWYWYIINFLVEKQGKVISGINGILMSFSIRWCVLSNLKMRRHTWIKENYWEKKSHKHFRIILFVSKILMIQKLYQIIKYIILLTFTCKEYFSLKYLTMMSCFLL